MSNVSTSHQAANRPSRTTPPTLVVKTQWVQTCVQQHVATLTLNHPEKRNALSKAMLEALHEALQQALAIESVRVIILAANGPAFCSGHDLKEMAHGSPEQRTALLALCTQVMECIRTSTKPMIASVQGIASAAGCQLVASCDLAIASETAAFQTPGVQIGLFCSTPMIPLSRVVAPKHAMEMLLTGQAVSATHALNIGLINRIETAEGLSAACQALAEQIAQYSSQTISLGKQAFQKQLSMPMDEAYQVGCATMLHNATIEDAQEGMQAFIDKRKPHWKQDQ